MLKSENLQNLSKALCGFQAEISDPVKNVSGYNDRYQYADLATVLAHVRPILTKHDLSFMQCVGNQQDLVKVESILMHSSGEYIQSQIEAPVDITKGLSRIQSWGSTISYLRRYSLLAALSLAQADNDGHVEAVEEDKPITASQIEFIENRLENTGIKKEQILKAYQIDALSELPQSKYRECVDRIHYARNQRQTA